MQLGIRRFLVKELPSRQIYSVRQFTRCVPRRSLSFSHQPNQAPSSTSNSAHDSSASSSSQLLLPLKVLATIAALYGIGTYTSLKYGDSLPNVYKVFDKYVPFGHRIIEYFEELEYQERLRTKQQYYDSNATVSPYISRTYAGEVSSSSATGSVGSEDPLSHSGFFDAKSGLVGTSQREYLPLVLLPETDEILVQETAMSLNDLISSINASAVHDRTVETVSGLLSKLALESPAFKIRAKRFDDLVKLRTQPQAITDTEYHNLLAEQVVETEKVLISYVNRHEHIESREAGATSTQRAPMSGDVNSNKSDQPSSVGGGQSKGFSSIFDNHKFRATEIIELQMSLTLLISALKTNVPSAPYIQGIRSTVAAYSSSDKEELLTEALQGVRIPDGIDLQPILRDIVQNSK